MSRHEAGELQRRAADPAASLWLTANAGSGKTRVLTDRVARLLQGGADPQTILCLTYTKAAASEMQNRLFARLGEWAMLPDQDLSRALDDLGVGPPKRQADLARARTLFARAIETPGGLKIQTIHALCAAILRRFPLEAGVVPGFVEIDEQSQANLVRQIVEDIAAGPEGAAIDAVARHLPATGLMPLAMDLIGARDDAHRLARLSAALRIDPGETVEALAGWICGPAFDREIGTLCDVLASGSSSDRKAAAQLLPLVGADRGAALESLEAAFLFGATAKTPFAAKIGRFPTAATRARIPDPAALDAMMSRVEDGRARRLALGLRDRTQALADFADALLPAYGAAKAARGWLDFDDLIGRTRRLLSDPDAAAWVRYKLDGDVAHVLVDEAQDTAPAQWDVIERLTDEFTSGEGLARPGSRTLFVVGDLKQSIYSFQGADADRFDDQHAMFAARFRDAGQDLGTLALAFSFRSASAILEVVDAALDAAAADLDASAPELTKRARHRAFYDALPGRVDLWPIEPPPEEPQERAWSDPVDAPSPRAATTVLSGKIADMARDIVANAALPEGDGARPAEPGDILILVQRRNKLFHALIAALKARGLPVAGADRFRLDEELAVKDILSLLTFLALPEDDLALAEALRSPLLGWSEDELYRLAQPRSGHLWAALRSGGPSHGRTREMLFDLRDQADFLRPFDLIQRILTRHEGRRRLIARLGRDCEDAIDELLSKALAYETTEVPSLTGFLAWLEAGDAEVKRQLSTGGGFVRVMSVHGAKGLEAPIVILPDTLRQEPRDAGTILRLGEAAAWAPPKVEMPPALRAAQEARLTAERRERVRLLYVAMTRARNWLIVAGAGNRPQKGGTWYDHVAAAMEAVEAVPCAFATGEGLRTDRGAWPERPPDAARAAPAHPAFPAHLRVPPAPPSPGPVWLAPTDLGGIKALPGEAGRAEADALALGTAVHRLLEHVSAAEIDRLDALATELLRDAPDPGAAVAQARAVLSKADLSHLFAPGTLAEVEFTSDLSDNHHLRGTIDRLVIEDDRLLAIDFKTNAVVPETPEAVPEGLLRQCGAYAHAMGRIYPGRRIETAILWTAIPSLMPLPGALTASAFRRGLTEMAPMAIS